MPRKGGRNVIPSLKELEKRRRSIRNWKKARKRLLKPTTDGECSIGEKE
jgi:hypothetical protein